MKQAFFRRFAGFLALPAAFAAMAAMPAFANDAIELNSEVFVERLVKRGARTAIQLEKPKQVLPGDRLVFILRYRNSGERPVQDFVVTNPMPEAVRFQETLDGTEEVSVDGGQNWDKLDALRIPTGNGRSRPARAADVTHVRWNILQNITKGSEGKLTFRGIVK